MDSGRNERGKKKYVRKEMRGNQQKGREEQGDKTEATHEGEEEEPSIYGRAERKQV